MFADDGVMAAYLDAAADRPARARPRTSPGRSATSAGPSRPGRPGSASRSTAARCCAASPTSPSGTAAGSATSACTSSTTDEPRGRPCPTTSGSRSGYEHVLAERDVREQKMFGGLAFMVGREHVLRRPRRRADGPGRARRLPPTRSRGPACARWTSPARPMRGLVMVAPARSLKGRGAARLGAARSRLRRHPASEDPSKSRSGAAGSRADAANASGRDEGRDP